MSAETVVDGLNERLRTVPGLAVVQLGDTVAPTALPMVMTSLAESTRETTGQITAMRYTFTHRLLLLYQEPEEAERELLRLANEIPLAIDADPLLDGRLRMGLARVSRLAPGYIRIADTWYRFCDFTSEVLEKGAAGSL